jgi:D-lactate dehydrogenase (cytochrome)
VYPRSTEEVSAIVKICARHALPIIAYGSGTSLEGHTSAPHGGVCIDFSRHMCRVLRVGIDDMDCTVQPGVTWNTLNAELAREQLFFPVDPGPGASIGGMVATSCSGTNASYYGTMKRNVLNLTVVLADGTIVRTAQRARKSAAGYDLTHLFVGSEGTLGIVTEVSVRLCRVPAQTTVASCAFDSIEAASEAVIAIMRHGVSPGCVELLDDVMIDAVNRYSNLSLAAQPTLFMKFIGNSADTVDADIARVSRIFAQHGGAEMRWARSKQESARLWDARKQALWAAYNMRPNAQVWTTDVCVPISRLADCINATKRDLEASSLLAPIVGHVADGNFHVLMVMDRGNAEHLREAQRLNKRMVQRAIRMQGTCTGEHGVGVGKREYLALELGDNAVELMRTLKRALDPQNLLNPGKVIDMTTSTSSSSSSSIDDSSVSEVDGGD